MPLICVPSSVWNLEFEFLTIPMGIEAFASTALGLPPSSQVNVVVPKYIRNCSVVCVCMAPKPKEIQKL